MLATIPLNIIREVKALDLSLGKNAPNQEIVRLLDRTLLLGGKRFRPLLTYLMSDFFELELKDVGLFARAIELTHSATLAHDDVIDGAEQRRGKPSINAASSNKMAILSGDYLLAQTMLELSQTGNIRYIQELSNVLQELVDGEWLQMKNNLDRDVTRAEIEEVALKKTASAISWCCVTPAIAANSSEEIIEKTRSFGHKLGIAFQEIDDAIDFQKELDKDQYQDINNGILNSVLFELIKINPNLREKLKSFSQIPWQQEELQEAIAIVRKRAHERLESCKVDLREILQLSQRDKSKRAMKAMKVLDEILEHLAFRKL